VTGAIARSTALTSSSVTGDNSAVLAGRDASEIGTEGVSSLTHVVLISYTNNMQILMQRIWRGVSQMVET
jgi:hypothetical protein